MPPIIFGAADCKFSRMYLDSGSDGLWGAIAATRSHPEVRSHLWDYLDRRNDAGSARHWHVAAGFYPNVLMRGWTGSPRAERLVMAAEAALAIAVLHAGLRLAGVDALLAMIAALLCCFEPLRRIHGDRCIAARGVPGLSAGNGVRPGALSRNEPPRLGLAAVGFAAAAATLELSLVMAAAFILVIAPRALRIGMRRVCGPRRRRGQFSLRLSFCYRPGGILAAAVR